MSLCSCDGQILFVNEIYEVSFMYSYTNFQCMASFYYEEINYSNAQHS